MKKIVPGQLLPIFTKVGFLLGLLLFITLSFVHPVKAQKVIWDKTIGGSKGDALTTVKQTRDGGYILGGSSTSNKSGDKSEDYRGGSEIFGNPNPDFWVVKLNADRTKAWDKTFGGDGYERLTALQQTQDGGYILGGYSTTDRNGDKTDPSRDESVGSVDFGGDFWIIKLNADGSKAWDKTYGGNYSDHLVSVQQTPDGGYILAGFSESDKSGDKSEPAVKKGLGSDYWIIKLRADGSKEWDKTYGGENWDGLASLQQTQDGGYILGGTSDSGKGGDKSEPNKGNRYTTDYWVIKLNADGTKVWDKTYGGNNQDQLTSLQQTADGGYILGGYSQSGKSGDKTDSSKGNNDSFSDYWVVKIDKAGTKEWDTAVGGDSEDALHALLQTQDGSYILGGESNSNVSGDKTEGSKGNTSTYDYWIVKLSASGKIVADKTIGSPGTDTFSSLHQTPDGNLLLGGTTSSGKGGDKSENSKGSSDFWVVKIEDNFKKSQTITFESIYNQVVGSPAIALQAKASSGLPIIYEVLSGPATIQENKLIVTGPGNVRLRATQSGNEQYRPAEALQNFTATLTGKQAQFTYGSNQSDVLTAMLVTADGGYLLGGTSHSTATGEKNQPGQGNTDYWVVKIGKNGQKQWDRTYGGSKAEQLNALVATSDGGYLLGGFSYSGKSGDKTQASKGKADYWLVKIDTTGNLLWDRAFGGTGEDKLNALLVTPDGYLLGGSSNSDNSGDKSAANKGRLDYWILKINQTGTKVWDKTYGGKDRDDLTALVAVPEGGYLIGGSSSSGVSGDKSQATRGFVDYWVLRLNEQGDKIWDKTYGGIRGYAITDVAYKIGRSYLTSMVATPDGNFLLGGSSSAFPGAERTTPKDDLPYVIAEVNDYWLVKINTSGEKIWDKGYGARSGFPRTKPGDIEEWLQTGNSELSTILPLPEGGYLLGGTSNGGRGREKTDDNRSDISITNYDFSSKEFGSSVPVVTWNDYWIVKIDEQGKKLEDRTLGGQRNDRLAAVVFTPEGNFLLGGTSFSGAGADKSSTNRGNGDYWLVEVSKTKPQTSSWDASYNGKWNVAEKLSDVIKTNDGGFLSGGTIDNSDYWIVKSDKQGNMLWSKTYSGSQVDNLSRLIQTRDGGYLLAGTSLSGQGLDKSQPSQGGKDYWIIKTDAQGNKQWDKRYGGSSTDELRKVIQLPSGEYVLAGFSNSPASGDKSQGTQGDTDYWVIKISNTGAKIWDKRFGGSLNETLGSFTATPDGGFFLGGTSLSDKGGDKTEPSRGQSDYWVLKLDKNGNLLWDKTYGGSGQDEAYSVGRGSNNQLFVAGHSTSPATGEKSQNNLGGKDYWLITLDAAGNKIWDKTFGGNQDDELRASTFTTDGGYLLGGTSASGASGDKTQASRGKNDYWAVKVDAQGNKQWDKRFGGNQEEDLRTVFQTKDGGFLLGGSSVSGVSGDRTQYNQVIFSGFNLTLTYDFWLVKIAPDSLSSSPITSSATQPNASTETTDLTELIAYPNPFQNQVTIRFTLPETQTATVRILDSQGKAIATLFQQEAQAQQLYEVEWQASKQEAGLYFLQLQTPTGQSTRKILLQK